MHVIVMTFIVNCYFLFFLCLLLLYIVESCNIFRVVLFSAWSLRICGLNKRVHRTGGL